MLQGIDRRMKKDQDEYDTCQASGASCNAQPQPAVSPSLLIQSPHSIRFVLDPFPFPFPLAAYRIEAQIQPSIIASSWFPRASVGPTTANSPRVCTRRVLPLDQRCRDAGFHRSICRYPITPCLQPSKHASLPIPLPSSLPFLFPPARS